MAEFADWLDQLTHKLLHQRTGLVALHAEDVTSGTFGLKTGGGAYTFVGSSPDVLTISGSNGNLRINDRVSANWWALYSSSDIFRFWRGADIALIGSDYITVDNTRIGRGGFYGDFACFARADRWAAGQYALLQGTGGDTYLNTYSSGYVRYQNNDRLIWDVNTVEVRANSFCVPGSGGTKPIYIKAWNDSAHVIQYYQPGDFAEMATWNRWKFWTNNALWFELGTAIDGIRSNTWLRADNGGTGWYNNTEGCGETAGNIFGTSDSIQPQHGETMLLCRKVSQGGWATAGLTSFGESIVTVPYMFLHANGCCSTSWRKNSGAQDITNVNGGGACDWVYAANHPICSERARKHNISVAEEYGLKTIRGLKPHKFQYTPTDEVEIWQWEKWKHDRAIGIWHHPPNEHCGWDDWHVGYFAEEMENLVPEIVGHHPDGTPRGIDYGNLVVVAIAAINELADRVEDLEAELASSRR